MSALRKLWAAICALFWSWLGRALPAAPGALPAQASDPYRTPARDMPQPPAPALAPAQEPDHTAEVTTPALDFTTPRYVLTPDCYPPDFGGRVPPVAALMATAAPINGHPADLGGLYLKATEGLGWGLPNETWFLDTVHAYRAAAGPRYGVDRFVGGYHFLRFSADGAAQADYHARVLKAAGLPDAGALAIMVDVEEGGQNNWAPGRLETLTPATKHRLAGEVTTCVTAFVTRTRELFPGARVFVYGRGVFRDLGMTSCLFGADGIANPAYTAAMPRMEQYGVEIGKIVQWQLCGDGSVACPGFPSTIPGWGATDYAVHTAGYDHSTWSTFFARALAFSR